MTAFLLYEQSGPVVTLTMNSPETTLPRSSSMLASASPEMLRCALLS